MDSEYKERSIGLADACADIALLKLSEDATYIGGESVPVDGDSCDIHPINTVGTDFRINTEAIFNEAETNIEVFAATADLSISSWGEVAVYP